MKVRLNHLEVTCKRAVYTVPFDDFTYFYGEMGAGKSTIARLIDYCFGGGLEMTPALQSEFVSATLDLAVSDASLRLERAVEPNQILASWGSRHRRHVNELLSLSTKFQRVTAARAVLNGVEFER